MNLLHERRLLDCHSPKNARAVFLWLHRVLHVYRDYSNCMCFHTPPARELERDAGGGGGGAVAVARWSSMCTSSHAELVSELGVFSCTRREENPAFHKHERVLAAMHRDRAHYVGHYAIFQHYYQPGVYNVYFVASVPLQPPPLTPLAPAEQPQQQQELLQQQQLQQSQLQQQDAATGADGSASEQTADVHQQRADDQSTDGSQPPASTLASTPDTPAVPLDLVPTSTPALLRTRIVFDPAHWPFYTRVGAAEEVPPRTVPPTVLSALLNDGPRVSHEFEQLLSSCLIGNQKVFETPEKRWNEMVETPFERIIGLGQWNLPRDGWYAFFALYSYMYPYFTRLRLTIRDKI